MAVLQGISLEALKEAMKESVREENKELVKRMDVVEANQQDTKRLLTETIGRVSALEGHGLPSSGALSSVSSTAATVETPFSGFGGGFGGNSDVGFGFAKLTSWGWDCRRISHMNWLMTLKSMRSAAMATINPFAVSCCPQ